MAGLAGPWWLSGCSGRKSYKPRWAASRPGVPGGHRGGHSPPSSAHTCGDPRGADAGAGFWGHTWGSRLTFPRRVSPRRCEVSHCQAPGITHVSSPSAAKSLMRAE